MSVSVIDGRPTGIEDGTETGAIGVDGNGRRGDANLDGASPTALSTGVLRKASWMAIYLLVVGVLIWPTPINLSRHVIGHPDHQDWAGIWHISWMLRTHGLNPANLIETKFFAYPVGDAYWAANPNYIDSIVIAILQTVTGPISGFNLGAWLVIAFTGWAVHRCARMYGGSDIAALFAGVAFLTSWSIAKETGAGRFANCVGMGFAALFFSELKMIWHGRKTAAVRSGVWLSLTALSYWFFGLIVVLLIALPTAYSLALARGPKRRSLIISVLISAGACLVVCIVPATFQALHLDDVPGVEGSFGDRFLPSSLSDARVLRETMEMSVPWRGYWGFEVILLTVFVFAVIGCMMKRDRHGVSWVFLVVAAMIISLGPYARVESVNGNAGGSGTPLPYLYLWRFVPCLWRFTWVNRAVMFVGLGLSVLAARGLAVMIRSDRMPRWLSAAVIVGCFSLLISEALWRLTIPYKTAPAYRYENPEQMAAYRWMSQLAESPASGAVISYPSGSKAAIRRRFHHLYFQTMHQHPMLNTMKGLEKDSIPFSLQQALFPNGLLGALMGTPRRSWRTWGESDIERLTSLGYRYILVHLDLLDITVDRFKRTALGTRLRLQVGSPERHGCLLVYDLVNRMNE